MPNPPTHAKKDFSIEIGMGASQIFLVRPFLLLQSNLKRRLNLVKISKGLDEKDMTKNEAYPLWIW